ncbi:MAG: PPOX class F420-dependent oxidoreductase [Aggregatilineales bacterium]
MAVSIPDSHRDLFDRPVVVTLVTVMPDGQPQATPVWIKYDGTHLLVNTARGRQKDRNMTRNSKVTVLSIDPDNPYRYVEVRGVVDEIAEEGALELINELARKYRGAEQYYGGVAPAELRQRETRVTYKIKPVRVLAH